MSGAYSTCSDCLAERVGNAMEHADGCIIQRFLDALKQKDLDWFSSNPGKTSRERHIRWPEICQLWLTGTPKNSSVGYRTIVVNSAGKYIQGPAYDTKR